MLEVWYETRLPCRRLISGQLPANFAHDYERLISFSAQSISAGKDIMLVVMDQLADHHRGR